MSEYTRKDIMWDRVEHSITDPRRTLKEQQFCRDLLKVKKVFDENVVFLKDDPELWLKVDPVDYEEFYEMADEYRYRVNQGAPDSVLSIITERLRHRRKTYELPAFDISKVKVHDVSVRYVKYLTEDGSVELPEAFYMFYVPREWVPVYYSFGNEAEISFFVVNNDPMFKEFLDDDWEHFELATCPSITPVQNMPYGEEPDYDPTWCRSLSTSIQLSDSAIQQLMKLAEPKYKIELAYANRYFDKEIQQ